MNAPAPQSVGRVVAILEYVVAHPQGATLSELAAFARAPKSSLLGLCAGLLAEGCLCRERDGRYRAGERLHALSMRAVAGRDLVALARPVLVELMNATGETAILGALSPDTDAVVYLDKVESANPIRYAVTVGERRELHCTALGKLLLAHVEPERLERFLATQPLQRYTPATITDPAKLRGELARVRRDGMSRNEGERVRDATGLAAPVVGTRGQVIAGVMIAGPARRMAANRAVNEREVRRAGATLSRSFGAALGEAALEPSGDASARRP